MPGLSASSSVGISMSCKLINTSNNIGIGKGADTSVGNTIRIGNTAITYTGVQVAWTITSDREWKSDIKKLRFRA